MPNEGSLFRLKTDFFNSSPEWEELLESKIVELSFPVLVELLMLIDKEVIFKVDEEMNEGVKHNITTHKGTLNHIFNSLATSYSEESLLNALHNGKWYIDLSNKELDTLETVINKKRDKSSAKEVRCTYEIAGDTYGLCPYCMRTGLKEVYNYCYSCGQKLNWEDKTDQ